MRPITRQNILDAICRTAKKNEGRPLGTARFEKETGIKPHEWGKYWARFGDAQKEAGFEPNQLQIAHSDELLITKTIDLIRKLGKFPTYREIQVEKRQDAELPSLSAFYRLGAKEQFAKKVIEFCENKHEFEDVIEICKLLLKSSVANEDDDSADTETGEVYLFKSGRYYKIGKTNDTVRRGAELRIQLPEKCTLIHSIKTDDPSGIEAYWHRRFEKKRLNGEWFDLTSAEIKAFKRWRRIV